MMMCPYNRAKEHQRCTKTDRFTEDGVNIGYDYDMDVVFTPLPCTEEKCGAWRNGQCHYKED